MSQCVEDWAKELQKLFDIAASHPQAAYNAFMHGLRGKWLYLARTIPEIKDLLQPLEYTIFLKFIPALTYDRLRVSWSVSFNPFQPN